MAIYTGFSTQNYDSQRQASSVTQGTDSGSGSFAKPSFVGRKFTSYDEDIVIQDLINAFNIPQGSKPGNPSYGTTLWGFIFEPNDVTTQGLIEDEVRRLGSLDPRIALNTITMYPQDNGILLEVEFAVVPFNNVRALQILFDQGTNKAIRQ
jgi:phage baseplate assembly protein W